MHASRGLRQHTAVPTRLSRGLLDSQKHNSQKGAYDSSNQR